MPSPNILYIGVLILIAMLLVARYFNIVNDTVLYLVISAFAGHYITLSTQAIQKVGETNGKLRQ